MALTIVFLVLAWMGLLHTRANDSIFQSYCSSENGLDSLQLSEQARIIYPGDMAFDRATLRWTSFHPPSYSMVVTPSCESDIQKLAGPACFLPQVLYALECGIPFLASSGAHGFSTTFGALQNGMKIDMSLFRSVSVNSVDSTLTVGGGVLFMDVIDPLYKAGKEINIGNDACVGMLSPSLGGGVGRYSGLHGMIGDQLLSLRVVTANGTIVTVSESENSDLFWAMKGAGNSFGIVAEATYQVFDLTSQHVVNADFTFSYNESALIIDYLASFGDDTPAELALVVWGTYDKDLGDVAISVNLVFIGSENEFDSYLERLLANTHPLKQKISTVAWNKLLYTQFFGAYPTAESFCEGYGGMHSVFGGAIKSYDKSAWLSFISDFRSFVNRHAGARSSVFFIEHFSKLEVLEIPDSSASYPWRDITAHLLWNYAWVDANLEAPVQHFAKQVRDHLQATSGFEVPKVYVNYGHGDEPPETIYSAKKLPKLRELKNIWDPDRLFDFCHSIM